MSKRIIDVKNLSIVLNNEVDLTKLNEVHIFYKTEIKKILTFLFFYKKQKLVDEFILANQIDFSGLDSATDFLFYKIGKLIENHPNKNLIQLQNICLNGCKFISIASMNYLYNAFEKTIYDLAEDKKVLVLKNTKIRLYLFYMLEYHDNLEKKTCNALQG
jgi:hypothetical protein